MHPSGLTSRYRLHDLILAHGRRSVSDTLVRSVQAALALPGADHHHNGRWRRLHPASRARGLEDLRGRVLQFAHRALQTADDSKAVSDSTVEAVNNVASSIVSGAVAGESGVILSGVDVTLGVSRSLSSSAAGQTLPDGSGVSFLPGSLSNSATGSVIDTRALQWGTNPHGWSAAGSDIVTGVTSIEVVDSDSGDIVDVGPGNATGTDVVPIVLSMGVPTGTALSDFRCRYWNSTSEAWREDGTVLLGFTQDDNGTVTAYCGSVHLTDFSAQLDPSFLRVNSIDPFGDAGLLEDVLDPSNLLPLLFIVLLIVGFVVAWFVSAHIDKRQAAKIDRLRDSHLLSYGEVSPGLGKDRLHLDPKDPARELVVLDVKSSLQV